MNKQTNVSCTRTLLPLIFFIHGMCNPLLCNILSRKGIKLVLRITEEAKPLDGMHGTQYVKPDITTISVVTCMQLHAITESNNMRVLCNSHILRYTKLNIGISCSSSSSNSSGSDSRNGSAKGNSGSCCRNNRSNISSRSRFMLKYIGVISKSKLVN